MTYLKKNLYALLAISAASLGSLRSEVVMSDPIGSMTVTLKGGSDTRFSVPMMRIPVFTGELKSVDEAGSSIDLLDASWADGRFVFENANNPDPNATYFAVVTSGTQNGAQFKIESNDANTLVVDPGLNQLTGLSSADVDGVGDTIKIYPYPTLASVFSGVALPDGTKVFQYNNIESTINKIPGKTYTYFESSDVWGDGESASAVDHTALLEVGKGFIVRTPQGSSDIHLSMSGSVGMFNDRKLFSNEAGTSNDISFALSVPIQVAIGDTNLNIQDGVKIFVYDNEKASINKIPSTTLTYFADMDVWGDGKSATAVDDTYFLDPGAAYVLRKPSTEVSEIVETGFSPSYLAQ